MVAKPQKTASRTTVRPPQKKVIRGGVNKHRQPANPLATIVLKHANASVRDSVSLAFNNAVKEHMPATKNNKYPVNYESRYAFIQPQHKYNTGTEQQYQLKNNRTFTAGNFNKNNKLVVSGSAAPTQAPAPTKRAAYNPVDVYHNILKPLVDAYAPFKFRVPVKANSKMLYNYDVVLRSRKSKSNEIHWHRNAVNQGSGTPVWQIIYYVDTPKTQVDGTYINANLGQRGKLQFVFAKLGVGGDRVESGVIYPQKNLGIGAIPDYFYHMVQQSGINNTVSRQAIVIVISDPLAKSKTNVISQNHPNLKRILNTTINNSNPIIFTNAYTQKLTGNRNNIDLLKAHRAFRNAEKRREFNKHVRPMNLT